MRDLDELFDALNHSAFRRGIRLNPRDLSYLRQRGLPTVMEHAGRFITERLAPAVPVHDGKQTPWRGHPVFTAQHATATCCRKCLTKWHRIPQGAALSAAEVDYVMRVIERWLCRADADGDTMGA